MRRVGGREDGEMPNAEDYAKWPEHPLNGVPQRVLDHARLALDDAVVTKDVDDTHAHPIADAVVLRLHVAGYLTWPQARQRERARLIIAEWLAERDGFHTVNEATRDARLPEADELLDRLEG